MLFSMILPFDDLVCSNADEWMVCLLGFTFYARMRMILILDLGIAQETIDLLKFVCHPVSFQFAE